MADVGMLLEDEKVVLMHVYHSFPLFSKGMFISRRALGSSPQVEYDTDMEAADESPPKRRKLELELNVCCLCEAIL